MTTTLRRSRNAWTWAPKWVAISDTCDFDRLLTPSCSVGFLHAPSRDTQQVAGGDYGHQRLHCGAAVDQHPVRKI
jgi:hypothetical protein